MKKICFLLACLSMISCTHIVFDVPQPRDVPPMKEFPTTYRGIYVHVDGERDSIIIQAKSVTFIEYDEKELSVHALDTLPGISLKDGLLYDRDLPEKGGVPYMITDTMILYGHTERFMIGLSDTLILKQIKTYLVVSANFTDDDVDYWDVYLTKLTKGGDLIVHTIGNLRTPDLEGHSGEYDGNIDDFAKIASYEKIGDKTYLFRPSKSQFLKLIKKGLFSETETYRKAR